MPLAPAGIANSKFFKGRCRSTRTLGRSPGHGIAKPACSMRKSPKHWLHATSAKPRAWRLPRSSGKWFQTLSNDMSVETTNCERNRGVVRTAKERSGATTSQQGPIVRLARQSERRSGACIRRAGCASQTRLRLSSITTRAPGITVTDSTPARNAGVACLSQCCSGHSLPGGALAVWTSLRPLRGGAPTTSLPLPTNQCSCRWWISGKWRWLCAIGRCRW